MRAHEQDPVKPVKSWREQKHAALCRQGQLCAGKVSSCPGGMRETSAALTSKTQVTLDEDWWEAEAGSPAASRSAPAQALPRRVWETRVALTSRIKSPQSKAGKQGKCLKCL